MQGTFRRVIWQCALVAMAIAVTARADSWFVRPSADGAYPIFRPTGAWPAALATVSDAVTSDLVAAVTADIDADGDLDVVATDQELNLLVWVNDGTGHLTRQHPRRSAGESTSPAAPAFERRTASVALSTVNDPPSAGLGRRPDVDAGLASVRKLSADDSFLRSSPAPRRASRAPPSVVLT